MLKKDNTENSNFIQYIKKRISKTLKVEPVFFESSLELKTIEYLKRQSYLDFSKIETLLKNDFSKELPFGYVLKTKLEEIVGFLGTMFCLREGNNKNYIYCNLHTWIVDISYRLNSYLLLLPLLEKQCVITTFTPIKTLIGLYQKFGFKKLEMKYRIIFLLSFFKFFQQSRFKITDDDLLIKKYLSKNDLKIYKDHLHFSCFKFIIIDKYELSNNIFVIAVKNKKKYFDVLDLLYVSNNVKFRKYWFNLFMQIAFKFNVFFCGQYFLSEKETSIPNKIFISKDIKKEICVKNLPSNFKFDTLYSEFIN